jgi:UDP-N-acetylglucosamine 2-epimerase (non-hydrolysing)
MKTILSIFGTRPEAIKMAPVVKELKKHPDAFKSLVCVTAQHREMLDQVLDIFDIQPDYDLNIMQAGQDLYDITANVLLGLKNILTDVRPDMVLVHGDTTTTMTATLAAFYAGIPVGHVEAGLRTHNKFAPFPEEINRKVTSAVCDLHFAPTIQAKQNLLAEGVPVDTIHVTGNTVIDALFLVLEKIRTGNLEESIIQGISEHYPDLQRLLDSSNRLTDQRIIIVTGHRRENFGEGFESICHALHDIAVSHPDVEIIYPVHLNPNVQQPVHRILGANSVKNIHLIDPMDYVPFVYLMRRSYLIITDSGGIQEEAPSLGKPVLVMREATERPEALLAGTARMVGTDRHRIVREVTGLLTKKEEYESMSQTHNPYGDGQAANRICKVLGSMIDKTYKDSERTNE